jgi:REP element-mobilizing transposase RayT
MGWTPFNGKLWQRDYYEQIIYDYDSFMRISNYIRNKPGKAL